MAGTILRTPNVGDADWTVFITQAEKQRKGFLSVSLTNPATTAASSIGTGGIMELSGSLYQFTETAISLAAGTPSAAQSVYYTVIPSGGGTTVTVVMEGTAPTWIDSKQGFYASAASTTRYIGGAFIGTSQTYYHKFIYTPQMLDYLIYQNKTRPILKKEIDIGEWNMDTTVQVLIDHGLKSVRIHNVLIWIRSDSDQSRTTLDYNPSGSVCAGWWWADQTQINVNRLTGGFYDGNGFDATASTVANRGWIHIEYEA